jgi:outer membrane protein OmpA-like peptidoglycan-associated protein
MAELNVQPKRKSNWWLWLLLAAIAIALIFFFSKGCNSENAEQASAANATTGDSSASGHVAATTTTAGETGSSDIDFNSPGASYEEITDKDISVRGTENYAIYSLGENVLFDVDKSTIRQDAEPRLKQISASLKKRFPSAEIRIYGRTDSTGDATHNRVLAEQRGRAVKNWIVSNAGIEDARVAIYPLGESKPVASNATEAGKQENRSVEIVAKNP